jgi:hypothetical protein
MPQSGAPSWPSGLAQALDRVDGRVPKRPVGFTRAIDHVQDGAWLCIARLAAVSL